MLSIQIYIFGGNRRKKQEDELAGFAQLWLEKMWHGLGLWQSV